MYTHPQLMPANKSAAVAMAKAADYVVLLMGIDGSVEAEGHDRTNTSLPGSVFHICAPEIPFGMTLVWNRRPAGAHRGNLEAMHD